MPQTSAEGTNACRQRNNQTHHNWQAYAQQNLLELTRYGRVHPTGSKGIAGIAQGASVCTGSPEEESEEEPGVAAVTLAFCAVCSPSVLGR